jgi:hypothetical protein
MVVLLAIVLPFETPVTRVGPVGLTTVEIALYMTLATWGVCTALAGVRKPRHLVRASEDAARSWLVRGAVGWITVVFASAAVAASHQAACVKFALRSLSGVFLFFATRSATRTREGRRWIVAALLAGGTLSALTPLIEVSLPGSDSFWEHFHEHGFDAYGLHRASGAFVYPTVGAMYWEALVPLVIVAPFAAGAGTRRARLVAVLVAAALFAAILATATRSALAGVVLTTAFIGLVTRRWNYPVARVALGALGMFVATCVITVLTSGTSSLVGQRLRFWNDDRWFRVEYRLSTTHATVGAGEALDAPMTLRNTGTLTWRREGPGATRLARHWYRIEGTTGREQLSEYDGDRTELPRSVAPGEQVEITTTGPAPRQEGEYRLALDLVEEGVTWFSEHGNEPASLRVLVVPGARAPADRPPIARMTPLRVPSRPALWRAAVMLWKSRPIFGVGPDNFRRLYEGVIATPDPAHPFTDERVHANSLYFETLADLGLAGLVALVVLAFAVASAVRQGVLSRDPGRLGVALALAAFFIHGLSDYFLEFTSSFGLFWLLAGLVAPADGAAEPGAVGRVPASSVRGATTFRVLLRSSS